MSFPTPYTVQHERWQSLGEDAHGNPIEGYASPVDVRVYGWSVPMSEETRDRTTVDISLYAPPDLQVGHRDQFVIPDTGTFKVEGEVEDYNHGPFGWRPGLVVNLQRIEG